MLRSRYWRAELVRGINGSNKYVWLALPVHSRLINRQDFSVGQDAVKDLRLIDDPLEKHSEGIPPDAHGIEVGTMSPTASSVPSRTPFT